MKLVFFGTPEFAVAPLRTLLNSEHEVIAVVTQPDRQKGRGRHMQSCPVKMEAQKAGIRILQPRTVRDAEFINELRAMGPDVIVVAAYGQILPSEIIRLPELGCVNIHASLLPKYRGAAPINQVIINGEKQTGITTMLMDEGMDTGPCLLKQETDITPDDTPETLSLRLAEIGAELLMRTLKGLESGEVKPVVQSGEPSYAAIMKKNDGLIQWSKRADELCNFVRGMNPWPGAYTFIEGERIKILRAAVEDGEAEPGVVCRVSKDELMAGTGKGLLSICEIQAPGKPVMAIKAFLQGRKIREGMKFDIE